MSVLSATLTILYGKNSIFDRHVLQMGISWEDSSSKIFMDSKSHKSIKHLVNRSVYKLTFRRIEKL